jgi:hypothetical protein
MRETEETEKNKEKGRKPQIVPSYARYGKIFKHKTLNKIIVCCARPIPVTCRPYSR